MKAAGTTGVDVFLILVGDKATTGKISIYGFLERLFGGITAGTCEDLIIETNETLGTVLVVLLGIDGGESALDNTWFVNHSVVKDLATEVEIQFPCYHWIGSNQVVSSTSETSEYTFSSCFPFFSPLSSLHPSSPSLLPSPSLNPSPSFSYLCPI